MKRVSTVAAALVAALLGAGSAAAIDTSIGPRPNGWNGFYAGVTAGSARGTTNWTSDFIVNSGDFSGTGTVIGVTFGRNWQSGRWVYGLEGDLSSSSVQPFSDLGCAGADCSTVLKWFGTFRGRLGYLLTPGLLVYGTAGVSVGKFEHAVFGFPTGAATKAGAVFGGGIEKVLLPRWTMKAEYLFLDNDGGQSCDPLFCGSAVQAKFNAHIFRLGLNHHFGAPDDVQNFAIRAPGWSGFYASTILGYGRGDTEWSDPFFGTTSSEFDGKGALAGFGAGYNWQKARWVFGVEGDAALTWIKAVSIAPFCLCFSAQSDIEQLFTLRARAGYLVSPDVLLYVTGGVAAASLKFGNVNRATGHAIEVGPAIGAGIEVQAIRDWTIKTEYLFASFGSSEACGVFVCFGALNSDYMRVHMMRFALNRYF